MASSSTTGGARTPRPAPTCTGSRTTCASSACATTPSRRTRAARGTTCSTRRATPAPTAATRTHRVSKTAAPRAPTRSGGRPTTLASPMAGPMTWTAPCSHHPAAPWPRPATRRARRRNSTTRPAGTPTPQPPATPSRAETLATPPTCTGAVSAATRRRSAECSNSSRRRSERWWRSAAPTRRTQRTFGRSGVCSRDWRRVSAPSRRPTVASSCTAQWSSIRTATLPRARRPA